MLIRLEDKCGCIEIFDTDVATFEDVVEALAELSERCAKTTEALFAAGVIVGDDGALVIFDLEMANAWFRNAEAI
jgi:hypothetical protein